jgi:hypothetical protein
MDDQRLLIFAWRTGINRGVYVWAKRLYNGDRSR